MKWVGIVIKNISMQITRSVRDLENLIHTTPTGDRRNLLTEANILIQAAQAKLKEAAES